MCSILLTNFFVSCSNEEQTSNIDEEKVQYVLQSKNSEVTKAAYQLLSPEEKYYIWDERTDYILAHEDLTVPQIDFLDELKSDLNSSVFEEDSTENTIFKAKYDNDKLSIFEPIQGYYYFSTLTNMSSTGTWSSIASGGEESKWDFYQQDFVLTDRNDGSGCTCNKGSIVNPDCSASCPTNKQTNSGCGFIWIWECNGYVPLQ